MKMKPTPGPSVMNPIDPANVMSAAVALEAFNVHRETGLSPRELLEQRDGLLREVEKLREELDWQNMPNRREPLRGGWEFYINEEWTGIRDAALGEDPGFRATLMKVRYDPDDERVRIRRVLDDDAILKDLAEARAAIAATKPEAEANPWDGIDADEFVRSVRDGSYEPENSPHP